MDEMRNEITLALGVDEGDVCEALVRAQVLMDQMAVAIYALDEALEVAKSTLEVVREEHERLTQSEAARLGAAVQAVQNATLFAADTAKAAARAARQTKQSKVAAKGEESPTEAAAAEGAAAPAQSTEARSGLAAIYGKWPGEETDEQIREALDSDTKPTV